MILLVAALAAAQPVEQAVTAPGPGGPLAGTLVDVGKGSPVMLIRPPAACISASYPGSARSGPTGPYAPIEQ